jgi:hypothetical protein
VGSPVVFSRETGLFISHQRGSCAACTSPSCSSSTLACAVGRSSLREHRPAAHRQLPDRRPTMQERQQRHALRLQRLRPASRTSRRRHLRATRRGDSASAIHQLHRRPQSLSRRCFTHAEAPAGLPLRLRQRGQRRQGHAPRLPSARAQRPRRSRRRHGGQRQWTHGDGAHLQSRFYSDARAIKAGRLRIHHAGRPIHAGRPRFCTHSPSLRPTNARPRAVDAHGRNWEGSDAGWAATAPRGDKPIASAALAASSGVCRTGRPSSAREAAPAVQVALSPPTELQTEAVAAARPDGCRAREGSAHARCQGRRRLHKASLGAGGLQRPEAQQRVQGSQAAPAHLRPHAHCLEQQRAREQFAARTPSRRTPTIARPPTDNARETAAARLAAPAAATRFADVASPAPARDEARRRGGARRRGCPPAACCPPGTLAACPRRQLACACCRSPARQPPGGLSAPRGLSTLGSPSRRREAYLPGGLSLRAGRLCQCWLALRASRRTAAS